MLELDVADFITLRYERGRYHVVSVERIVSVDLRKLWEQTASSAITENEEDTAG